MEKATFGGGCFWCTGAIFKNIKGVKEVISGYSGGNVENPTYEQVSSGSTHHAEVIQLNFDPKVVSYNDLLYIFFKTHDPTTINRQGADVGDQYRSVVFYANEAQKKAAHKAFMVAQKTYERPIVTQILPLKTFYPAENYHQDYYSRNSEKLYCKLVIDPKIDKLKKSFKKLLK